MEAYAEQLNIKNKYEDLFIAVDVETTGFSPIYNELIEVSAIKYNGCEKLDTFSTLIKPKCKIPINITRLTNITEEMVEGAPYVEFVIPELVKFIGDCTIVAHNASFDMGFLQNYSDNSFCKNKVIDTVGLSRKMHPELPNHKLGTIAKHIGIEERGFHRAEFDCECAARIYMKYLGLVR